MAATREQRTANLDRANEARYAQSQLKREIGDGRLSIDAALTDPRAASMDLIDVLRSQRRWGVATVCMFFTAQLLTEGIGERKRVGSLTARQCRVITDRVSRMNRNGR